MSSINTTEFASELRTLEIDLSDLTAAISHHEIQANKIIDLDQQVILDKLSIGVKALHNTALALEGKSGFIAKFLGWGSGPKELASWKAQACAGDLNCKFNDLREAAAVGLENTKESNRDMYELDKEIEMIRRRVLDFTKKAKSSIKAANDGIKRGEAELWEVEKQHDDQARALNNLNRQANMNNGQYTGLATGQVAPWGSTFIFAPMAAVAVPLSIAHGGLAVHRANLEGQIRDIRSQSQGLQRQIDELRGSIKYLNSKADAIQGIGTRVANLGVLCATIKEYVRTKMKETQMLKDTADTVVKWTSPAQSHIGTRTNIGGSDANLRVVTRKMLNVLSQEENEAVRAICEPLLGLRITDLKGATNEQGDEAIV
ncbi:hypothetical protein BCR34DRAFT_617627 [Clohesyomyces aquaticus]|uniref:Uncharacterized protein n=1 Tax=Clohesyomyces aquaticus TaxID=1231657 RepID=A0A1Y1Z0V3_9PLEO|nr:hypothetical protein BCR34DRAFT_617627 [Clohesyomyces aquaticus]